VLFFPDSTFCILHCTGAVWLLADGEQIPLYGAGVHGFVMRGQPHEGPSQPWGLVPVGHLAKGITAVPRQREQRVTVASRPSNMQLTAAVAGNSSSSTAWDSAALLEAPLVRWLLPPANEDVGSANEGAPWHGIEPNSSCTGIVPYEGQWLTAEGDEVQDTPPVTVARADQMMETVLSAALSTHQHVPAPQVRTWSHSACCEEGFV